MNRKKASKLHKATSTILNVHGPLGMNLFDDRISSCFKKCINRKGRFCFLDSMRHCCVLKLLALRFSMKKMTCVSDVVSLTVGWLTRYRQSSPMYCTTVTLCFTQSFQNWLAENFLFNTHVAPVIQRRRWQDKREVVTIQSKSQGNVFVLVQQQVAQRNEGCSLIHATRTEHIGGNSV